MNAISKRLAWKEAAILRPICIACLVLLALLLFAGLAIIKNPADYSDFVGNMSMMLGGIVGLACGIILFVFERESGTDRFLEVFPVDGRAVARAKLLQAFKYFLLYMIGVVLIAATALAVFDGGMPRFHGKATPLVSSLMLALIALECFLWALVCSVLMKSSLRATILSAFLAVTSAIVIGTVQQGWVGTGSDVKYLWGMVGAHCWLSVCLAVAVWILSPNWLRGRYRRSVELNSNVATDTKFAAANSKLQAADVKCAYPFKALMWQNVRRCWIPWSLIAVGLIVIGFWMGSFLLGKALHAFGTGDPTWYMAESTARLTPVSYTHLTLPTKA